MLHPRYVTLSRFVAGDLPPRRRTRVAGHLERCARCRARVAERARLSDALRTLDSPAPPEGMLDRIIERRMQGERVIIPVVAGPAEAPRRLRHALPMAAAILLGMMAVLAISPPVRAWVRVNAWEPLVGSEAGERAVAALPVLRRLSPPALEQDVLPAIAAQPDELPPLGIARTATFVPHDYEVQIRVDACQERGKLEIEFATASHASVSVMGPGSENLVASPTGLRIANSPTSIADYRVTVPVWLRTVRIELGPGGATYLLRNGAPEILWTVHLQRDLNAGHHCRE